MRRLLLALLFPFASYAQVSPCLSDGGYFKVNAHGGLNLRKEAKLASDKVRTIPDGETVFACIACESFPNETIAGRQGCWKKAYYQDNEGYVFDAFLEAIPGMYLTCPADWVQQWDHPLFPKNLEYVGVYDAGEGRCSMEKLTGVDSLVITPSVGMQKMIRIDQINPPGFIISGLPNPLNQAVSGRFYHDKMLFPGESILFESTELYAKGFPLPGVNSVDPIVGIKDYQLLLRQPGKEGKLEETLLFQMNLTGNGTTFEGGVHIRWVGDLDQDGKLDILLTYATHYSCYEVMLLLSTKAMGRKLVGVAASYRACKC